MNHVVPTLTAVSLFYYKTVANVCANYVILDNLYQSLMFIEI